MSSESLREQMGRLKSMIREPKPVDQPTTLRRDGKKVVPREITGSNVVPIHIKSEKNAAMISSQNLIEAAVDQVVADVDQAAPAKASSGPWTKRARGKVEVAVQHTQALTSVAAIHSKAFDDAIDGIDKEANSIRKKAILEAEAGPTRHLTAIRRAAETVQNLCMTLREGKRVRDIELGHLKPIGKQMVGHLQTLTNVLIDSETPKVEKHVPAGQLMNERSVAEFRNKHSRLLKSALSTNKGKAFFWLNMPVLPVFDGVLKTSVLADCGLPVEDMAGYPVMMNQKLMVVDPEVLNKRGMDRNDYVTSILARMNEKVEQPYVLVTDLNQQYVRDHMHYYWLMTAHSHRFMMNATGKPLAIREWALAF